MDSIQIVNVMLNTKNAHMTNTTVQNLNKKHSDLHILSIENLRILVQFSPNNNIFIISHKAFKINELKV